MQCTHHNAYMLCVIRSRINKDDAITDLLLQAAPMRVPKSVTSRTTPPPCVVMCLRPGTATWRESVALLDWQVVDVLLLPDSVAHISCRIYHVSSFWRRRQRTRPSYLENRGKLHILISTSPASVIYFAGPLTGSLQLLLMQVFTGASFLNPSMARL
jgi:hypothetical protein